MLPFDFFLASLRRGPQLELKLGPVSWRDSEDFQSAGPEMGPIHSELGEDPSLGEVQKPDDWFFTWRGSLESQWLRSSV